jgi:alpha,alpha-trehalose phosphorylase
MDTSACAEAQRNGFYETRPIVYGEDAYGFAKTGQTICNVTDSKIIQAVRGRRALLAAECDPPKLRSPAQHEAGTLDREILWETPAGKQVSITSRRLISFANRHVAAISYRVILLNAQASNG